MDKSEKRKYTKLLILVDMLDSTILELGHSPNTFTQKTKQLTKGLNNHLQSQYREDLDIIFDTDDGKAGNKIEIMMENIENYITKNLK